jgi:hypothetical protein
MPEYKSTCHSGSAGDVYALRKIIRAKDLRER